MLGVNLRLLSQFELPIPIIKATPEAIAIKAFGSYEGVFVLENIGPGELAGRIYANSPALILPFEEFSGNNVEINYILNLDGYKIGDKLTWRVVAATNGGEVCINFDVEITAPAVVARDGPAISSLEQFAAYTKAQPVSARQLFTQQSFLMWLFNSGYKYMDLYERFVADPNKERAVDNFLVMNGLKSKAQVRIEKHMSDTNISLPLDGEARAFGLKFSRNDWGYSEGFLSVVRGKQWLTLSKSRLSAADFDEENYAEIDFIVTPDNISAQHDSAVIELSCEDGHIERIMINVGFKRAFDVRMDKEVFSHEDRGALDITNNTGAELKLEVIPMHGWVRFASKNYIVSREGRLPFDVRYSAWGGGFSFRKQLHSETWVTLRAVFGSRVYSRRVKLLIRH